jgi:hypothetical protein
MVLSGRGGHHRVAGGLGGLARQGFPELGWRLSSHFLEPLRELGLVGVGERRGDFLVGPGASGYQLARVVDRARVSWLPLDSAAA